MKDANRKAMFAKLTWRKLSKGRKPISIVSWLENTGGNKWKILVKPFKSEHYAYNYKNDLEHAEASGNNKKGDIKAPRVDSYGDFLRFNKEKPSRIEDYEKDDEYEE